MKYELTLLINQEAELKNVKDLISSLSGKVDKEEKWGEKTLAYSIKKNHRAMFYNLTIDVEKSKTKELRQKLNFNDKLIRYLLLVKNS
ncbi:30S ribosomal protein S6 [Patescibacteria group bacterium]|nr:30S ribosomal protein S6 [Patescibacteria group bacterium]